LLIAEDNLLNRDLLRDQLLALGARVIATGDGTEAMAALADHRVDAVLTDIDMPGMSGFDLLREIRRADIDIPVYAVSASARPEDVAAGQAKGFTGYLTKPVSLAMLASVLARAEWPRDGRGNEPPNDEGLPELPRIPGPHVEAFLAQSQADLDDLDEILATQDLAALTRLLHRISRAGGARSFATGRTVRRPARLRCRCAWLERRNRAPVRVPRHAAQADPAKAPALAHGLTTWVDHMGWPHRLPPSADQFLISMIVTPSPRRHY
jgi:CheY-like chemotaxis protein